MPLPKITAVAIFLAGIMIGSAFGLFYGATFLSGGPIIEERVVESSEITLTDMKQSTTVNENPFTRCSGQLTQIEFMAYNNGSRDVFVTVGMMVDGTILEERSFFVYSTRHPIAKSLSVYMNDCDAHLVSVEIMDVKPT